MSSFEEMMVRHGRDFDNTEAAEYGFDIPDGNYIVIVKSGTIKQSKGSGRWQISWDLVVIGDKVMKYANRHIFTHHGITTVDKVTKAEKLNDFGVSIIKRGFKALGFPGVTSKDFDVYVERCTGLVASVEVKTSKDGAFQNTNFTGLIAANIGGYTPPTDPTGFDAMVQAAIATATGKTAPVTPAIGGLPGMPATTGVPAQPAAPLKFD